MNSDTRRRLVGVLGLLASNHDGERAAAGLLATRLLRAAALTWDQVIPEWPLATRPDTPPASGWRSNVVTCLERPVLLSVWERQFLTNLMTRKSLSAKQASILAAIYEKVLEADYS
jgi:hypothetical protein